LILVGHVLKTDSFDDSYLYDEKQAHVYRPKVKPKVPRTVARLAPKKEQREESDSPITVEGSKASALGNSENETMVQSYIDQNLTDS